MPAARKEESNDQLDDLSSEEAAPAPKRRVSPRINKGRLSKQKPAVPKKKKKKQSDKEYADDSVDVIDSVM